MRNQNVNMCNTDKYISLNKLLKAKIHFTEIFVGVDDG